jgi:hypothetical protein
LRLSLDKAILEGGKVVVVEEGDEGLLRWGAWTERAYGTGERQIGDTCISRRKHIRVSTVFLGLDHGWGTRPMWFETMIFGSSMDGYQMRYETIEEARLGHALAVGYARRARWTRGDHCKTGRQKMLKSVRRSMKRWKRRLDA